VNPLHVLLLTDDAGLAKGFSDAFADHAEFADVEAVRPDDARVPFTEAPDVVIVDDGHGQPRGLGMPPEEMYPDSLVLQLRDGAEGDVEGHFRSREFGYVRREDLEEVAPVIVALAGLSRVAGRNAAD
jgi:hypothetical protein